MCRWCFVPPEVVGENSTASRVVAHVLAAIEDTDVETIELEGHGWRVRVVQNPGLARPVAYGGRPQGSDLFEVNAPLAGIYYARSAPDQPPFVTVGEHVMQGQTVGLIETMKLFNEIVSDIDGRLQDILVAEGDLVEKDQALMLISPNEGGSD